MTRGMLLSMLLSRSYLEWKVKKIIQTPSLNINPLNSLNFTVDLHFDIVTLYPGSLMWYI